MLRSFFEPDFEIRSVIAAVCILPWANEEVGAGTSTVAPPEFAFPPCEAASGPSIGVDEGVAPAADCVFDAGGSKDELAVDACAAVDAGEDCTGAHESRKYHAPLAAATIRPAATAIQIPLPLLRAPVNVVALSPNRVLPNTGVARACFDVRAVFFAATGACFAAEANSGACGACHSSNCSESLAAVSAGGAGIAALRANGSSQAGIFTSSASKLDVTGAGVSFGAAGAGEFKSGVTDLDWRRAWD